MQSSLQEGYFLSTLKENIASFCDQFKVRVHLNTSGFSCYIHSTLLLCNSNFY